MSVADAIVWGAVVAAGVAVMDACRKAGFPKVSFIAPPPKAVK